MGTKRFEAALNGSDKLCYSVPGGMAECVAEMAGIRGVSVAEYLRRVTAAAILEDLPPRLDRLSRTKREQIELLADLAGS